MTTARAVAAALLAGLAMMTGCGGDDEPEGPTATLHVTRDFGRTPLLSENRAPLPDGGPTVLQLLRDHADAETSDSGRHVLGIDGLRRYEKEESETTWALNVNGIEADVPARDYRIDAGDVVQFDYRDWYVLFDVRATVGAFPETFTRGMFGRRFPTTVECSQPRSAACRIVRRALTRAGVAVDGSPPPGMRAPRQPNAVQRARVLVGPWRDLRDRREPARIDRGARYSGVFARFTATGDRIHLLDWDARPARTAGAGSGLVAAIKPDEDVLLWLVTGVDAEGVERAARALDRDSLRDAFAVVVTRDGLEPVPLPLRDPDAPRDRVTE